MAGWSVPVAVHGQTQLGGQLPSGTLIINQDPTNSVWIKSDNGVSPGNGIELGPLGTMTWQTPQGTAAQAKPGQGTQAWACVDIGVTTPIILNISTDGSQLQNPVAIGAAIATLLIEEGITVVATTDLVFSSVSEGALPLNPTQNFPNSGAYDISKWQSVSILLAFQTSIAPNDCIEVTVGFGTKDGNLTGQTFYFWGNVVLPGFIGGAPGVALPNTQMITIPCQGTSMTVSVSAGIGVSGGNTTLIDEILIYGSSRAVPGVTITNSQGSGAVVNSGSIPAHTTWTYYLCTVVRALQLSVNGTVGSQTQLNTASTFPGIGSFLNRIINFFNTAATSTVSNQLFTQGEAPSLALGNPTAGALSINASVTDAS